MIRCLFVGGPSDGIRFDASDDTAAVDRPSGDPDGPPTVRYVRTQQTDTTRDGIERVVFVLADG